MVGTVTQKSAQLEPVPPVAIHEVVGGGGTRLYAREWGARRGPAILFVHGWSQCDACWTKQVSGTLADRFRMVTFDLRGHGLSDKPAGTEHYVNGRLWADDVAAVIEQTGLDRPVIVAWSYGGYIVEDYLRAHGDTAIAGLNLVGAGIVMKPANVEQIGAGLLDNAPDMCGPDLLASIAATRRFLANCTAQPLTPDESITALGWNMAVPPQVRAALFAREIDGGDALVSSSVPVLVTHGRDDAIVQPAMGQHTLNCCTRARPSWYDGVGHMPFWEAPGRFDLELAEFVAGVNQNLG